MIETFNPSKTLSPGTFKNVELKVVESNLGDGYTQRSGDGLNPEQRKFVAEWKALNLAEADAIEGFFMAHKGFKAFLWQVGGSWTTNLTPVGAPTFPIDVFRIEQKTNQNRVDVEWTLAAVFDQEAHATRSAGFAKRLSADLPAMDRNSVRLLGGDVPSYCSEACFGVTGAATTPAKDRCSKRLKSGCIKRYGSNCCHSMGFRAWREAHQEHNP